MHSALTIWWVCCFKSFSINTLYTIGISLLCLLQSSIWVLLIRLSCCFSLLKEPSERGDLYYYTVSPNTQRGLLCHEGSYLCKKKLLHNRSQIRIAMSLCWGHTQGVSVCSALGTQSTNTYNTGQWTMAASWPSGFGALEMMMQGLICS